MGIFWFDLGWSDFCPALMRAKIKSTSKTKTTSNIKTTSKMKMTTKVKTSKNVIIVLNLTGDLKAKGSKMIIYDHSTIIIINISC